MSRSMISLSSFLKEDTNEMGGRAMRMTLNKDTGSAADIRDRVIDFLGQTDVSLLVVGRSLSSAHRLRTVFMSPFPQYCVHHARVRCWCTIRRRNTRARSRRTSPPPRRRNPRPRERPSSLTLHDEHFTSSHAIRGPSSLVPSSTRMGSSPHVM